MRTWIINGALGFAAGVMVATPATALDHPAKANKFLAQFVKAYAECVGGGTTHNPPLDSAACTPDAYPGSHLSFGDKGFMQAVGVVKLDSFKQAMDVSLTMKAVDIVDDDLPPPDNGFNGTLYVFFVSRITDTACPIGDCTVHDRTLPYGPLALPCGTAASPPLPPGKCFVKTSFNSITPGLVVPGTTANIERQHLRVFNFSGGLEFTEGLYLP